MSETKLNLHIHRSKLEKLALIYSLVVFVKYFISWEVFASESGVLGLGWVGFFISRLGGFVCGAWLFWVSSTRKPLLWAVFGLGAELLAVILYIVVDRCDGSDKGGGCDCE